MPQRNYKVVLKLFICLNLLRSASAQDSNGYRPHSYCNVVSSNGNKCGTFYSNPISRVLDRVSNGGTVSSDKCLWCSTSGYFDCNIWDGKAYELGDETDSDDCSWTGCRFGGCDDDEEEVDYEWCGVNYNEKCCKIKPTYKCCDVLDCTLPPSPPPPPRASPPPLPSPPPPLSPQRAFSPPSRTSPSSDRSMNVALGTTNSNSDQPSRPSSSSPIGAIVGALMSVIILFPSTTFSILVIFFKPYLRKKLLQYGWRRTADIFVPDLKFELRTMSVKVAELEAFLAKQKLPRIKNFIPDIEASDIILHEADVLGSGGYGYVLKGTFNAELVAIKVMFGIDTKRVPASVTKIMRREAMIMCSLNHPNILKIHGVVADRGMIVMELCEGGALDEVLQDPDFVLDHPTRLRIAAETATGIAYLHLSDVSIVHGDIKAGNVLLTVDLSVRICDFGMSEAKNRSKTMSVKAAGARKGGTSLTVAWSAPELFKDRPKTFATDVYALGLTIWEIYERRVPFGNMPEAAVVNQILSGVRPEMGSSDMPNAIRHLIQLCWSEEPSERPAADKIAFILTRLLNEDKEYTKAQTAAAEQPIPTERKGANESEAKTKASTEADESKTVQGYEELKAKLDDKLQVAKISAPKIFCTGCGVKLRGGKFCTQCGVKC